MIKIFFYWLFHKSKTLQQLSKINQSNAVKVSEYEHKTYYDKKTEILLNKIKESFGVNQNRFLRRKWKRITSNPRSPFYIYK